MEIRIELSSIRLLFQKIIFIKNKNKGCNGDVIIPTTNVITTVRRLLLTFA